MDTEQQRSEVSPFVPMILLASDNPRLASFLHGTLAQEGLSVHLAPGYDDLEPLSLSHQSAIALIEVSHEHSVEAAVKLALRLKRRDTQRFVGYLADPILHNSGLAGDAIFPRSIRRLPAALREHFGQLK